MSKPKMKEEKKHYLTIETYPSKDMYGWLSNIRIINSSIKNAGLWKAKWLFSAFGYILLKKTKNYD